MTTTAQRRRDDLDVDGVLGPRGALEAVLPGYEHRPAQLQMARAVQQAFERGEALLAEAGTGTGKTLAYLVPAVLSGLRVVISTATRTLQEQIFLKDLPLLRDQVGLEVSAALLKGRNNYLCLHRLEAFDRQPLFAFPEDAAHWPAFRKWAQSTQTGDRGETTLPDAWGPWGQLSTTSETCLGGKCPQYEACFVTRARQQATQSELVVVNHALFFADLALKARGGELELGVLPAYDAVVFDEAHALEDVATEYFGQSVSLHRVVTLAHDVLEALRPLDPRNATLCALGLTLKTRAERFFQSVSSELALTRADGRGDTRISTDGLVQSGPTGTALQESLSAVAAFCPQEDPDLGALHRRALDAAETLRRVMEANDPSQVYWATSRGRNTTLSLAPIDVGRSLDQHLYAQTDTVIFTSATLATERGRFDYLVERLGLGGRKHTTLRVEAPFDYAAQSGLYLPGHLPEPTHPEWTRAFAREALRLVRLTGGRAFMLFTSLKHLDEVHALLSPHLDVPALKQGQSSRRALLEAFHERPSVLFASQSFWEGVDVPGETLSLVIIDRLPFAPPGEPLQAARIEAVRARGEEPFADYQLPQAALALRQGFGRLIRTRTDRGIVALGDVRVSHKRYGKVFLDSLPPARRFSRFDELAAWWTGASL